MSGTDQICDRCATTASALEGSLPAGWSLATTADGVTRLCADCTRANLRAIEARLDEDWW